MGMRGEWRRVARKSGLESGLQGKEELDVEVVVALELELELEVGLLAAALVGVLGAVHKSVIKPVHDSSGHKLIHKTFVAGALFSSQNIYDGGFVFMNAEL